MVDGAPFLVLGRRSTTPARGRGAAAGVAGDQGLHANTVEMPVGWEQLEPSPGDFDFSVVDALIAQARKNDVRLILLWFGTWKNSGPNYMPRG